MTEKLKPCPFCGGKANFRIVRVGEDSYKYRLSCSNPKCFCSSSLSYSTREEAVNAWNNRPIENELVEKISKLESEKQEIA